MAAHTNTQLRRDPRLRSVQVRRCEAITPHMRRIVFGGSDLAGFQSDAPDDHIKLFFPNADGAFVLPTMTRTARAMKKARCLRQHATTRHAISIRRAAS